MSVEKVEKAVEKIRTRKAGKTRTRILEAARTLFNEQGERQVSTNHIAASLGMSPGNLYYHFRNKTDIVRALLESYSDDYQQVFDFSSGQNFTMEHKRQLLEGVMEMIWHYRFIHRDIEYLLTDDEPLREGFVELSLLAKQQMTFLFRLMGEAGMVVLSEEEQDALVYNSWMVLTSCVGFVGAAMVTGGHQSDALGFSQQTIRRAIYQVLMLDKPYVTPAFAKDFQSLLDDYRVSF